MLRFSGVVTYEEIVEARRIVIDCEDFKHRKFHIWFFDNATEMLLDSEQMKVLRTEDATNAAINRDLRVALVGNTDISFGMLRMYESYATDFWRHVAVFRNLEDAWVWAKAGDV
ncbi:hypothetical protein [Cognatishimia sp.]|uniref:hypothetical protein n=1 Tax=Cognatishimia sp. TaxID=2211648 RepID=UPI003514DAC9